MAIADLKTTSLLNYSSDDEANADGSCEDCGVELDDQQMCPNCDSEIDDVEEMDLEDDSEQYEE